MTTYLSIVITLWALSYLTGITEFENRSRRWFDNTYEYLHYENIAYDEDFNHGF